MLSLGAWLLPGCAHHAVAPPPPRVLRIVRPAGNEPSPVFSVQADAERVYFNDGAGRLWSAPKDGSAAATPLVDDPRDAVRSFALRGDTIYYAARQAVRSVPALGGPSSLKADNPAGPVLVVSDGEHVYHTVFDGGGTPLCQGSCRLVVADRC